MKFKELHENQEPILVCNVWDAQSAIIAEELGYSAIGTSSGAIAAMLGYQDGEEMSFEELQYVVQRIVSTCTLPLSVDLEAGYSRTSLVIAENIQKLEELGVVGINLEDSLVMEERVIQPSPEFARLLEEVSSTLKQKNVDLFLNVRTDTYLLNMADSLNETIERAHLYEKSGADGLFVPCMESEDDIRTLTQELSIPLNVMAMPDLPKFDRLQELGVKRISMGNFVHNKLNKLLLSELTAIKENNSFQSIFN